MALDERGHRLVVIAGARRVQQFEAHADLCLQAEEAGQRGGNQLGGHHEHQAVGQRHEAVADDNVCLALGVVRGRQFGAQAHFTAEFGRRGLLGQEGVRSALKDRAIDDLRG